MGLCDGRVVVVTGAGRGVGRAYALMLAAEGARVVVNDLGGSTAGDGSDTAPAHSVVEEIRAAGGEAIADASDVADWDQAAGLIETAIARFGALDVLINNAGILRDRMLVNMSEADWDAVIRVHLKGTFAPTHHAANYWRLESKAGRARDARIINTTSASGLWGNIGQGNYAAAKAGIASLTLVAARELQRIAVTVNAIAPRAESRMTEGLTELTDEARARRDPEWIAALVTWLASPAAADISGRVFEAWGNGYAIAQGWQHGPIMPATRDPGQVEQGLRHILGAASLNQHYERDVWIDP
ncbi:SDR family NAD(P)-dependent oxidoreductase [Leptolyngbya sp. 15MV]|nr:SDR family NAD(P)-dependent oxidoreductase [Leptolyngbya sp. 15MV]